MSEFSGLFDSTADDPREYSASKFADYFGQVLTNGVFNGGTNLQVTCSGTDINSRVQPGYAWIKGYMYKVDTDALVLAHALPHATLNRIDRVVLRLDLSIDKRYIKAFVLPGTPAASPVAPALTRSGNIYEISLANVLIIAGKSFIESPQITDERLNTSACGLVNSLIQVDTSAMQAEFDAFMEGLSTSGYVTGEQFNVLDNKVTSHLSDSMILSPQTGSTANAILLTPTLKDKTKYSFKTTADSTGAVTINGYAFKKLDGTAISNLKANKVYDFYYSSADNCVFILAKATGNAPPSVVLAPYTFSNDDGEQVGTYIPPSPSVGDFLVYNDTTNFNAKPYTTYTWGKVRDMVTIKIAGSYRITWCAQEDSAWSTYFYLQLYKNGVAIGTQIKSDSSFTSQKTFTQDVTCAAGDVIQMYAKMDNPFNGQIYLNRVALSISSNMFV